MWKYEVDFLRRIEGLRPRLPLADFGGDAKLLGAAGEMLGKAEELLKMGIRMDDPVTRTSTGWRLEIGNAVECLVMAVEREMG